ncbi:membrane protein insertion efficiency factor YidD [Cryomorphaceae bacterium 1068]|nr:membrane protein insertion efficiency factor YidD [Cryomorphaceae bacterium 1068]
MKVLNIIFIGFVRFYQVAISPWFGANCRFTPTCSSYTIEAINEWGAFKGTWMGIRRISKCHPWGSHGYDPVPRKEKTEKTKS